MSILSRIFNAIYGAILPRNMTDVDTLLRERARGRENLDWGSSIVDLMKLLDLDSSFEARRTLAAELGRDDYSGKAEENMWLHREVMEKVTRRELG